MRILNYRECLGLDRPDRLYHISGTDINPSTGKMYAINPSSGVYDDNYFAQNFGGSSPAQGGGASPYLSAPDLVNLRSQVYDSYKNYYLQLATEAQGDFNRATQLLKDDYVKGVRDEKINFANTQAQQTGELQNALASLGISNIKDQQTAINDLNQRGMAVYQNNPNGTPNVLQSSPIISNTNFNVNPGDPYNTTSTIQNPQNPQMGRGGYELSQLQQDQQLRQEAQQRTSTRPIQEAGIRLKQYTTGLPTGVNTNQTPQQMGAALSASGVDRSTLGTAERTLFSSTADEVSKAQKAQETLANQRFTDVNTTTAGLAQNQIKNLDAGMTNQLQQQRQNTFAQTGVV